MIKPKIEKNLSLFRFFSINPASPSPVPISKTTGQMQYTKAKDTSPGTLKILLGSRFISRHAETGINKDTRKDKIPHLE
jgi:hypothetical protein